MNNENSVTLLSMRGSTILVPVIQALERKLVRIDAVILDGSLSEKDQNILKTRLEPTYEIQSVDEIAGHSFEILEMNHNSEELKSWVNESKTSYLVNAGTPRILKNDILSLKKGVVNCHPGLLPDYRGCTCVEWAIYNDDPVGVTAHFMNEKVDEGPVILSKKLELQRNDTYRKMRTRMIDLTAETLADALRYCLDKNPEAKDLPAQKEGRYYKPIPDEYLNEVVSKVEEGRYLSL